MLRSPVTGKENAVLERNISVSSIIEKYKKELNVDVSRFFTDIEHISIYKDLDTGYRFYYPLTVAGDDAFYQELEKFSWYYMDWKWEHSIADRFIKRGDKVLEIGCAQGAFLKKMQEKGADIEGLEMNSDGVKKSRAKGLIVYPQIIEEFSKNKNGIYDVVCSFQVMEHVPNVKNFIDSSLSVLKPGGLFIVSVPNNDSAIFQSGDLTSNMPPHHTGLWNLKSLISLQHIFPMQLKEMHFEPFRESDVGFLNTSIGKKLDQKLKRFGPTAPLLRPISLRLARLGILAESGYIPGHTILVIFQKNG